MAKETPIPEWITPGQDVWGQANVYGKPVFHRYRVERVNNKYVETLDLATTPAARAHWTLKGLRKISTNPTIETLVDMHGPDMQERLRSFHESVLQKKLIQAVEHLERSASPGSRQAVHKAYTAWAAHFATDPKGKKETC